MQLRNDASDIIIHCPYGTVLGPEKMNTTCEKITHVKRRVRGSTT
jgi:hypothetical protein